MPRGTAVDVLRQLVEGRPFAEQVRTRRRVPGPQVTEQPLHAPHTVQVDGSTTSETTVLYDLWALPSRTVQYTSGLIIRTIY